jgi:hypothetical protein
VQRLCLRQCAACSESADSVQTVCNMSNTVCSDCTKCVCSTRAYTSDRVWHVCENNVDFYSNRDADGAKSHKSGGAQLPTVPDVSVTYIWQQYRSGRVADLAEVQVSGCTELVEVRKGADAQLSARPVCRERVLCWPDCLAQALLQHLVHGT